MSTTEVDLPVDLNSEDDTGLPWGFLDESPNPSKITEGAWITVGSTRTRAVAQVVDIADGDRSCPATPRLGGKPAQPE